jgi:hypothetical protein
MNPNLIEVFKPSNPDEKLYADQKQLNDLNGADGKGGKLIRWSERAKWLAKNKKPTKPEKPDAEPDGEEEPEPVDETETPAAPVRTKAELHAELDAKGIAYTKKMNVEQLEKLLLPS